nr:MAG TPA: hypothetical protein [Crassvirales sp.]
MIQLKQLLTLSILIMSSINKKNKAKNSYVFRNKSLVEKKLKIKRLYFFNSCMRRLLKEELKRITNVL